MARATWVQTNFNGGEWSPLTYGRFDLAKFKNGLAECLNYVPTQQGGLTRRPGTRFVSLVKDSSYAPRLQKFEFSATQAYVLEFGDRYVRFFTGTGQLQLPTPTRAWSFGPPYEVGEIVYEVIDAVNVPFVCLNSVLAPASQPSFTPTVWYRLQTDPNNSNGAIVELPTPYAQSDLWGLDFEQKNDVLYIAHVNHPVQKLKRRSAYEWELEQVSFLDGPYLNVNTTSTTLTPSQTSGTASVVASDITGINGGVGFKASDVGRALRIKCGGVWLGGVISQFVTPYEVVWDIDPVSGNLLPVAAQGVANVSGGSVFTISVTEGGSGYGVTPPSVSIIGGGGTGAVAFATVVNGVVVGVTVSVTGTGYTSVPEVQFSGPTGIVPSTTSFWRLGVWGEEEGYPGCVAFHQDRLCFSGPSSFPNRVDASNTGDYETFSPSNLDGTVVDSNAFAFGLNAGTSNPVQWMTPDEWGLMLGTAGGEWVISPSSAQQAITPTNVNAKQISNYGSCSTKPVRIGKAVLFVQRTQRKVRELFYQFTYNTFQVPDISLVGEHLTKSGIKQMSVQFAPQQIVWIVRNDGKLIGLTYDKDQEVCGWHGHVLGGISGRLSNAPPLVESVACIPAVSTQRDVPWMVVHRRVNGETQRSIEYMSKTWEDGDTVSLSNFLDSSAESVSGSPSASVTGLWWLKGETVSILADGATLPDQVVSSTGTLTLPLAATTVQIGYRYTSRARTLNIEAGGADGPSQGKLKRIYKIVLRFFQTIGISIGSAATTSGVTVDDFRSATDDMSLPIPLFSGDRPYDYEADYDTKGELFFETSDPLPNNITMLMARVDTQDAL